MVAKTYVRWFTDILNEDVPIVGGKNASLGELYSALGQEGVKVPNGFALTAQAYRDALSEANAWEKLHALLDGLDPHDVVRLADRA
jgi:pyruvate,water dikinase